MESTWSELFITWFKDFAGNNYRYLIVLIVFLPLFPIIFRFLKKIKPVFSKVFKLLNIPENIDKLHKDVQLFNRKITAVLQFVGEAVKGVAFFECNIRGECLMVTRYWTSITGLSFDESIGFGWVSAVTDDDRERVLDSWLMAVEQKREWRSEFYVIHRETRVITRLVGISLVLREDGSGQPIRYMRMLSPL